MVEKGTSMKEGRDKSSSRVWGQGISCHWVHQDCKHQSHLVNHIYYNSVSSQTLSLRVTLTAGEF